MKPDSTDAKILRVLLEDGRASIRKVARRTDLTAPTVSARLARMRKAGLIKKFVPVLDPESGARGMLALVGLKAPSTTAEGIARAIAGCSEVEGVYLTAGDCGLTLKLALGGVKDFQPFLKEHVFSHPGVEVVSTQVVTSVVKDELPSIDLEEFSMDLKCDYCGGAVVGSRTYNHSAGSAHYYFCCRTCRSAYLEEHGPRLEKLAAQTE